MPKAKHPKAASFVRQKLFAGVTTFSELETRIAALPDALPKGDAFEVFAEAYLATQRKHDAAEIWPGKTVPLKVLTQLALPQNDYGVDGVFKTVLGEFNAYQVKFRTNRPKLTWRELSKFIGLADCPQIHSRVLITNCDEFDSTLNKRQGFFCIRGSDLDRLEVDDFCAIEAWLSEAAAVAQRKTPQRHQKEALDALLPALETHDRVSAIMACGSGKTLAALWVAEKRLASRILVLVPSLALLRQILHEWLRETNLPSLAYLCVCSDPTVKEGFDSIATPQSDLDFQVSTDAASVRGFLDASFTGTKAVFCTYQSAKVVGAALKPGEAFDLAVFDEAHKTAGHEDRNFAFALEDANLRIRKRLFLTATPRHYNPHKRDREGDAKEVFSMNNEEVYGPQAFRLTFAEAARRGIICGYKVIISVITSEKVTNELLSHREVIVNGDAIRARQVANQIALRDAVEKYEVSKVFTFHRDVKSAKSFVAGGNEGIRTHLPEFEPFHVNGTMPTARREREMRDFREATRAVMSNARCLTEGVDVPAVDMVAFLAPRRSRVDIVQATGRAMRRSPGKTTGYVLVPLYVEQAAGESIEDSVRNSKFDEVWDVLNSLQEQDDVLAELIRQMGESKEQAKGFDDGRLLERVEIDGIAIGLETLRSAVTTRCFERLISSWDEFFGKLVAYKKRSGDCNVGSEWKEDPELGRWVSTQRVMKDKGRLSNERAARLSGLGFEWDWRAVKTQENWMRWYRELENYAKEHGNPKVTASYANKKLGNWVWTQRQRLERDYKADKKLTVEQVALLDKLGYDWDPRKTAWQAQFEKLKLFKEKHGHFQVEAVQDVDEDLQRWVSQQRSKSSRGKLDSERKAQLEAIAFPWDKVITDIRWDERYARLQNYFTRFGNSDVPSRWKDDPQLASWVSVQRERRKKGRMTDEQVHRLEKLGFTWKHRERGSWADRFAEVEKFKAKHGHCEIPLAYPDNPKLGRFINAMRTKRNKGTLSADRFAKLDSLGFLWASNRNSPERQVCEPSSCELVPDKSG